MEKRIIDEKLLLNYEQWLHENERQKGIVRLPISFFTFWKADRCARRRLSDGRNS